jgi:TRAP-type transport system small permease protein
VLILRAASAVIRRVENGAAVVLLAVICSVTAAQVVFRFILKAPLAWSDELATFSFVWFALLGAAIGVRERAHIGVDVLVRSLPPRVQRTLGFGGLAMIQLFLVCLLVYGIQLMLRIGDQRSSGMQIHIFWVYLALPVSGGLMLLHTLPHMARLVSDSATGSADASPRE